MANAEGHLTYKGFEAWVVLEKQPLPQFGVEYREATREATAWIPSEAGKAFSVCYRRIPGQENHAFTAYIYLDGNLASKIIYRKSHSQYLGVQTISSIAISATETRDFMFNPIELTDDDAFLKKSSAAQIGEIKIDFQTVLALAEGPPTFLTCLETGKLHERSKKGVDHQIKYSETKTRPPCDLRSCSCTPVDEPVTFIFKYRPLGTLQAKGIAPRPTPPAETNDDEEDEDEITAREQALLAELEQIRGQKRARKDIERPVKRAKTEPVDHFLPGAVIDLTEELEEVDSPKSGEVIDLT